MIPTTSSNHTRVSKLEAVFQQKETNAARVDIVNANLQNKIDNLQHGNRLHVDESAIQYWESKKIENFDLYKLSQTVLSVPSTQVTVERAFSALALVLTQQRTKITSEHLNNTLVVRLNADIVKNVKFEDFST